MVTAGWEKASAPVWSLNVGWLCGIIKPKFPDADQKLTTLAVRSFLVSDMVGLVRFELTSIAFSALLASTFKACRRGKAPEATSLDQASRQPQNRPAFWVSSYINVGLVLTLAV
jgi:hypothetical protein